MEPVWLVLREDLSVAPERSRKIVLQLEHTIVAPGGRGVDGSPLGYVPLSTGPGIYHVRLEGGPAIFGTAEGIIEYSCPNVTNVLSSELAGVYRDRAEYIAPLLSGLPNQLRPRAEVAIATMHGSPDAGRRGVIRRRISRMGHIIGNIENVWANYGPVFDKVAILVNVHQTEQHHTLEELRVLPAVERGVIVVTEDVPLLDDVPYREFLIAVPYCRLAETVDIVARNYEEHWNELFGDGRLGLVHDRWVVANKQAFARLAARLWDGM